MSAGETDIYALLSAYIDAGHAAGMAEAHAGRDAETDPDVDRAWETIAKLRTEIGTYVVGIEDRLADADALRAQLRGLAVVRDDLGRRLEVAEEDSRRLDALDAYKLLDGGYDVGAGSWLICYGSGNGATLREAIDDAIRNGEITAPAAPAGEPAP